MVFYAVYSGLNQEELRTIVDVSQESGVIEKEEKELINNVFDFGDSVAKDIMLPRIDVSFASVDMSYDELVEIFLEEQYSRLPVYEESKDKVKIEKFFGGVNRKEKKPDYIKNEE